MQLFIPIYLPILTLWKGEMEITARFMAALMRLHDNWSTCHAAWCLQCHLYALNFVLNGKSHSLEILITGQSHYIFACTKQKIYTDVCLTSYCPLHIYPSLTFSGTILLKDSYSCCCTCMKQSSKAARAHVPWWWHQWKGLERSLSSQQELLAP